MSEPHESVRRLSRTDPVVIGVGARTSIGLDMPATSAAVRGAVTCFAQSEYLRLRETGQPITLALLSTLPEDSFAYNRMKLLGSAAAGEALDPWLGRLAPRAATGRLAVLVSVPPPRPGFPEGSQAKLAREMIESLPTAVARERCSFVDTGHEGGLALLGIAGELLATQQVDVCLVGGVESYKHIDTLHWLEAQGRLKTADQPNGIVPGEGAGFLLLSTRGFAHENGARPLAELRAASRAIEPKPWHLGEPTLGEGLTAAVRGALDPRGTGGYTASMTYADLNGETWRVDEWGYAYMRTARHHQGPLDIRHPADCWGDLGAASGALLAALCSYELARARNSKPTALVWTASDTRPLRAACLFRSHQELT